MLCLSRRINERIFIGDDIEIIITDIDRGKIRLGITAPKDRQIYRSEIAPLHHPLRKEQTCEKS